MSGASLLSALLGLSFVSDFIKRHAVNIDYGNPELEPWPPCWLEWGHWTRGDLGRDGNVIHWPYVRVRVPGWYWERDLRDFGHRSMGFAWHRKYLVWGMYDMSTQRRDVWQALYLPVPR